jgi:hypothetical protein
MSSGARPGSIMSFTWGRYDTAVSWVCPGAYSAPPEPIIGYCYTSGILPPERWRELEKLYMAPNPLQFRREIDAALNPCWRFNHRISFGNRDL